MASPKRTPVYMESHLINCLGVCWHNITNKKIRLQMDILAEMLNEEINKKEGRKKQKNNGHAPEKHTDQEEFRFFIGYFKQRYAQETDIEYRSQINKAEVGIIKALLKKLRDKSIDVETYLSWVFDDFFDDDYNRSKYTPMINFIGGTYLVTKFFMENQPKIRKIKVEAEKTNRRETIRDHAKSLFRRTKDPKIQKKMELEFRGSINLNDLERFLEDYEINNNTQEEEK